MRGIITRGDVLRNFALIWREFGPACLWRCLRAVVSTKRTTFLELAVVKSLSDKPSGVQRVTPSLPGSLHL
jgi:hypothetical protein